ncbi:hypothetical protein E2562_026138 [Oryza meyeriana var. granulata]|uniref:Uncharacterized protein n=1 Tax=Oryza meyeriana var. granulata TaxID=110450 RepID=A0A6G1FCR9_9ORYZ|nr:hypothetical protein E2562_026138 [Oryza meyeriana var. granulata]
MTPDRRIWGSRWRHWGRTRGDKAAAARGKRRKGIRGGDGDGSTDGLDRLGPLDRTAGARECTVTL